MNSNKMWLKVFWDFPSEHIQHKETDFWKHPCLNSNYHKSLLKESKKMGNSICKANTLSFELWFVFESKTRKLIFRQSPSIILEIDKVQESPKFRKKNDNSCAFLEFEAWSIFSSLEVVNNFGFLIFLNLHSLICNLKHKQGPKGIENSIYV